ncbi:MAG: RNase J family beta-CASP ribonuclease, partial [Ghiorsea sp.]|nr:RNase J family beta-CASP ribonuclease [Ghiorsea sp.]
AVVLIDQHQGTVIGQPELLTRGVLNNEVSEDVFEQAAASLRVHLQSFNQETLADMDTAREEVRLWVRRWCKRKLGRRPMVVTTILEV